MQGKVGHRNGLTVRHEKGQLSMFLNSRHTIHRVKVFGPCIADNFQSGVIVLWFCTLFKSTILHPKNYPLYSMI